MPRRAKHLNTSAKRRDERRHQAANQVSAFQFPWLGVAAIILLTLAAYIPAFGAGEIWDDSDHVTHFPIQRTATALKWIWFKLGATPQYYPLTHTTFWLEYRLWGMNFAGYHTVNIVLHILCALLVWRVLNRLRIRGAWLVAAIFAVHPVNVESVAWITERKNTLSALFYLLATLMALRAFRLSALSFSRENFTAKDNFEKAASASSRISSTMPGEKGNPALGVRRGKESPHASAHPWIAYGLCLFFFLLAVLSKTVTCTFPAVVVLILWWKNGRLGRRDWLMLAPFFAIALAMAKLTSGMEKWNVGAVGPEFQFSFAERLLIAGRAGWFYAGKLVWPYPLIFMYPRWNVDARSAWQWLFPVGAAAVIIALFFARRRIGRGPLTAVLFFVGTLFPALGFVDVYPMRFSFVADHFQYLASIGILILIVQALLKIANVLADMLGSKQNPLYESASGPAETARENVDDTTAHSPHRPRTFHGPIGESDRQFPRLIAAGALLVALAVMTYRQAVPYHDDEALWRATLAKNPDCWLAMDNLGADAAEHGDRATAFAWYDRSLAAHPDQFEAHVSLGRLYAGEKPAKFARAQAEFSAAETVMPNDARPVHETAQLLVAEGKYPAAVSAYEKVLALEPKLEAARMQYANLLRALNRPADAEIQYRKALEINPDSWDARSGLAGMAYLAGDIPDAIQLMSEATDLNPTDPALFNNYGVFLMSAHKAAEAAEQFKSAIVLDPTFADAWDGLGNALAEQGNRREAIGKFRKALELKPDFPAARQHLAALESR